ncbi:MAG: serine/threonine-protein kinase [Chloroflexota bacterium]
MQLETHLQIRQYTLEQRIGSGASGEVWRAQDGTRVVALKFMNEQLMTSEDAAQHRDNLVTEIHALRLIQHPNVPALYDHDLDFERPYLVMEYVEGQPYDRLISGGEIFTIEIEKRLDVLGEIAGAISAVHAAGIIHRDIKPAHISGIDRPYLLDFSVALERAEIPRARQNVGTALYMPTPHEPPDELSDQYSFALTAYEILFGRHAIFSGDDTSTSVDALRRLAAERIAARTWRLPSALPRPELPGDLYGADLERLDSVFEKALAEREERYRDLGAFVDDLKKAILIPSNQPYLDNPLRLAYLPNFAAPPIPAEASYTLNEVAKAFRRTDHPRRSRPKPRWDRWLLMGLALLSLAGIVLLLLLTHH